MKKIAILSFVVVSLTVPPSLLAQSQEINADLGAISVQVERIWAHRLGYVVQYRLPRNRTAMVYLPAGWFVTGDSRAEMIALPPGGSVPSMSVFFNDGEFTHLRLYVHRMHAHGTWGFIPSTANVDDGFAGVETLVLEF
ncbi:MAG: hypothetical protein FWE09_02150 [Treponema sp.]|nr:hypothetical protein [Treponema sp.]